MEDTAKYLIHATIAADGVVERSDVVGAVFGQTEGLLGDELDLRDLQQSSKVGRIDVAIESENGQSFGELTVASSLEKVETAILGASLETITRVGPCQASVEVTSIEDVRAAKRREVVDRAKELLASGFRETSLSSDDVLEEVRDAARVEGISDYEELPAGPRVGDSDAVIVVEGRADVLTLLDAGIKNAVAVEGTNIPDAVAKLTVDRTVTAFLDGDRGGELILRELGQVGEVDYVAFAPAGRSVEDLDRGDVLEALRAKVPYATVSDEPNPREAAGDSEDSRLGSPTTESTTRTSNPSESVDPSVPGDGEPEQPDHDQVDAEQADAEQADHDQVDAEQADAEQAASEPATPESKEDAATATDTGSAKPQAKYDIDGPESPAAAESAATNGSEAKTTDSAETAPADGPRSLREHAQEVIDAETGLVRLLDADGDVLSEVDAADAFDAVESAEKAPHAIVLDGEITQRLLDIAAQRGVSQFLGARTGEFVKKPIGTRVRTAADLHVEPSSA